MLAGLALSRPAWSWAVAVIQHKHWSESDQAAIRQQMDRVLHSGPFRQSQRRQRFLEYLVNETLAGRGERLKGYNVGLEVFDRPETFDPVVDPIVRIEAARLREKLLEYYAADGKDDPIHIDLPKGTYAPLIEFLEGEKQVKSISKRRLHWQIAAPALALILVLGAVGAWLTRDLWGPGPERPAEERVLGVPQGPAIAVLPFINLSGDPQQEYFSDGLTEDLMTALSRASSDLRVLARNTTFQYKGKPVNAPELGRELGVRYVLEGSVRRADDDLRVTAQLIDTETGAHIWADKFDRKMADIFLVQDEIVSRIVAKIAGNFGVIEMTEAKSATRKNPNEIQAYDLVLRAQEAMRPEYSHETFSAAKELLRQAIALDPLNARARRELAYLAVIGWVFRFDDKPLPPQEITAQAAKAVQLDPADARAHMVAASAYFFTKQFDLFEREAQQAIALAPYDGEILATVGHLIASSGQWQRGVALAKKANELNADAAVGWYHAAMYYDYYLQGDYERALEFRRLHVDQQAMHAYIEYIPVYGQLGRKQEAQENWRKLLADVPGASAETFEAWYHLWNMRDVDIAKLMDGVYKSGVLGPEAKPGQ
jgi:TolB-like protein/tetratricopeptide (TPR) repeat protein